MKVYLVYWHDGCDPRVYGIFSTKQKAEEYQQRMIAEYNDYEYTEYYNINEIIVDEPIV